MRKLRLRNDGMWECDGLVFQAKNVYRITVEQAQDAKFYVTLWVGFRKRWLEDEGYKKYEDAKERAAFYRWIILGC